MLEDVLGRPDTRCDFFPISNTSDRRTGWETPPPTIWCVARRVCVFDSDEIHPRNKNLNKRVLLITETTEVWRSVSLSTVQSLVPYRKRVPDFALWLEWIIQLKSVNALIRWWWKHCYLRMAENCKWILHILARSDLLLNYPNVLSRIGVIIDVVWIGNWIYWTLKTRNLRLLFTNYYLTKTSVFSHGLH
jgi:hypothetical protein